MSVFTALLNRDYTIYPKVRTSDGQGGWTESYEPVGTAVRGRMRPVSGSERESASQYGRDITHVLYVPATVDIRRGDMVAGGGITVEVLGIREPSQAAHHLEIDCLERQLEAAEASS